MKPMSEETGRNLLSHQEAKQNIRGEGQEEAGLKVSVRVTAACTIPELI